MVSKCWGWELWGEENFAIQIPLESQICFSEKHSSHSNIREQRKVFCFCGEIKNNPEFSNEHQTPVLASGRLTARSPSPSPASPTCRSSICPDCSTESELQSRMTQWHKDHGDLYKLSSTLFGKMIFRLSNNLFTCVDAIWTKPVENRSPDSWHWRNNRNADWNLFYHPKKTSLLPLICHLKSSFDSSLV